MDGEELVDQTTASDRRARGDRIPKDKHQQRVRQAAKYLAMGYRMGEIKTLLAKAFRCSRRSVERYVRRGRQLLDERMGQTRDQARADVLEHLYDVLNRQLKLITTPRDRPQPTPAERFAADEMVLRVVKQISDIRGLAVPKIIHHHEGKVDHQHRGRVDQLVAALRSDPDSYRRFLEFAAGLPALDPATAAPRLGVTEVDPGGNGNLDLN